MGANLHRTKVRAGIICIVGLLLLASCSSSTTARAPASGGSDSTGARQHGSPQGQAGGTQPDICPVLSASVLSNIVGVNLTASGDDVNADVRACSYETVNPSDGQGAVGGSVPLSIQEYPHGTWTSIGNCDPQNLPAASQTPANESDLAPKPGCLIDYRVTNGGIKVVGPASSGFPILVDVNTSNLTPEMAVSIWHIAAAAS